MNFQIILGMLMMQSEDAMDLNLRGRVFALRSQHLVVVAVVVVVVAVEWADSQGVVVVVKEEVILVLLSVFLLKYLHISKRPVYIAISRW